MGRKFFIIIVIIVIVAGGGYYLLQKNKAQVPSASLSTQDQAAANQPSNSPQTQIEPPVTLPPASGTNSAPSQNNGSEQAIDGNNVAVAEVDFDGTKFTPAVTNINAGDWVFFKNKSTVDFWPASDPHPTHTDYPVFDALKNIAPGGEYKFQFTKVGNWGFYDHLDPGIQGTINVSK